jgi:hypothetical protein
MAEQKKSLGQFYTTREEYILQGCFVPEAALTVIEPFCGQGDLLKFVEREAKLQNREYKLECYDLEPKHQLAVQRDTLKNPPEYLGKFVVTNPPYLARNKSSDKSHFDENPQLDDLYKIHISHLITGKPMGGVLVIPLNFWSSKDFDLRAKFLQKFKVLRLNIFNNQVFDDTSYTICAFQFDTREPDDTYTIDEIVFYPDGRTLPRVEISSSNNWTIGGKIYTLPNDDCKHTCTRATSLNAKSPGLTKIFANCIDSTKKIGLSLTEEPYIDTTPKLSARSFATLVIEPPISDAEQTVLVQRFNQFFNAERAKWDSLFLTNYRENGRKRITFELVYRIVKYLLSHPDNP